MCLLNVTFIVKTKIVPPLMLWSNVVKIIFLWSLNEIAHLIFYLQLICGFNNYFTPYSFFTDFQKYFFGILNSPKKRTTKFDLITVIPQVDLFSFVFWRKAKTPKNHFEIIWPSVREQTPVSWLQVVFPGVQQGAQLKAWLRPQTIDKIKRSLIILICCPLNSVPEIY